MTLLHERPSTVFAMPTERYAPAPAEYRGLRRDQVRLLVANRDGVTHTRFMALPDQLRPGDAVVVNRSATVARAWDAHSLPRGPVVLHAATQLSRAARSLEGLGEHSAEDWVIEVRTAPDATHPVLDAEPGEEFSASGLTVILVEPYPRGGLSPVDRGNRLWRARVEGDLRAHLRRHGRPITYGHHDRRYPLRDYQTVFGSLPGSAEMPSAGRPFTHPLVTALIVRGIAVVPVTLHTGVSSQEAGEIPQPEWFDVPASTARLIEAAKAGGGRVVAVGTTVTRALESAVADDGGIVPGSGWTERVLTPAYPPRVVTGLITGWHDPQASHLLLIEAVAGRELTQHAYNEAVGQGYLWHEFGDSALFLAPK